jgi:hypothetical protein
MLHPVIPTDSELLRKPRYRYECKDVPRPCPFVSCKFNNYLDVDKDGEVYHLPIAPEEMGETISCTLDAVGDSGEKGGMYFLEEEIANILHMKLVDVRNIVDIALRKLRHYRTAQPLEQIYREWGNDKDE